MRRLLPVLLLFSAVPALAETWTGGGKENSWNDGANWAEGRAPAASAGTQIYGCSVIVCKRLCREIPIPAAMGQHQSLFRALHLLCQVLRTLLDRFSPVLVDIQRPILVHILERKSIVLDDLYAGSL